MRPLVADIAICMNFRLGWNDPGHDDEEQKQKHRLCSLAEHVMNMDLPTDGSVNIEEVRNAAARVFAAYKEGGQS